MSIRHTMRLGLSATALLIAAVAAGAATFTVKNNCGYTVYPGIYPAVYQNGGWSMSPGASVSFQVSSSFNGRIWGRQGCDNSSPALCASGQCGGTGLQCANTTGVAGTSLAEFNLDSTGNGPTDWYDVSYVDGIDTPIGIVVSNSTCVSPNTCTKFSCPTVLQNGVDCLSPCTQTGNPQYCCAGSYGTPQTCIVSQWPSNDQAYVNDIHNDCPNEYAYAYDDSVGLHTCPTGTGNNYTITFCPNGSGSTGGTTGGTTGSTTGGTISNGVHTLTPQCATGSRLDDSGGGTTNGNHVIIWQSNGGKNQQWNFANIGGNTFNAAVNIGPYCLDDMGGGQGTQVGVWSCNGGTNQKWTAMSVGSNFQFKDGSGLCLDVYGASSANNTKVVNWPCNSSDKAQVWAVN